MARLLGNKPLPVGTPLLAFSALADHLSGGAGLASPPASLPWAGSIGPDDDWGLFLNNAIGDCTIAAADHMIMAWSDRALGGAWTFSDKDAKADFDKYRTALDSAFIYNILESWMDFGMHRRLDGASQAVRIDDVAHLNIHDKAKMKTEVMQSIQLFGGCYIGLVLPAFAASVASNGTVVGGVSTWTKTAAEIAAEGDLAKPNKKAGHAVNAIGYDEQGVRVVTWGKAADMSWDFFLKYTTEAWAILCSAAWVGANGQTPSGLTGAQLQQDFAALKLAAKP